MAGLLISKFNTMKIMKGLGVRYSPEDLSQFEVDCFIEIESNYNTLSESKQKSEAEKIKGKNGRHRR